MSCNRGRGNRSVDNFLLGRNVNNRNSSNNDFNNTNNFNTGNNSNNGNRNDVETIVSPTETVVNPTTNRRTVRRVHPTHVVNVNRNITRVENYYPVTESVKNVNVVEEYNCGSDLRNPCCKPVKRCNRCCR